MFNWIDVWFDVVATAVNALEQLDEEFQGVNRGNVFDKAGVRGARLLQKVLREEITHQEASDLLAYWGYKSSRTNVTTIVGRIRRSMDPQVVIAGNSMTDYMTALEAEDIATKVSKIIDKEGNIRWEIDPVAVMYHNLIRLDKLIMMGVANPDKRIGMMIEQTKMAERLIKVVPPKEETIDFNELFRQADEQTKFALYLSEKYPDLDIKKEYVDFVARIKGGGDSSQGYEILEESTWNMIIFVALV